MPETRWLSSRKQELRERLLAAAHKLLEEQGCEGPSVDAIASRAGVAKGTFYLYFKSKAELLEALMEDAVGDIERRTAEATAVAAGPREALRAVLHAELEFFSQRPALIQRLLLAQPAPSDVLSSESAAGLRNRFESATLLASERAIRLAMLQQDYAVGDARLSASALCAMFGGMIQQAVTSGAPLHGIDAAAIELFEQGMCRRAA